MLDIVIATRNPHKIRELVALIAVPGIRWRSLAEFPSVGAIPERGRTFRANAITKAKAAARATGGWALADDSGIEVDVLEGAPGIHSARFAGRHGDDQANNQKLLRVLAGVPSATRTARYRCVLVLASPQRVVAVTEGVFEGRIARAQAGRRGFGYDPIFTVPRLGKTAAQLSTATKHRISHRGKAARAMRHALRALI